MASSQQSFLAKRLDSDALPLAVGDVLVLAALITFGVTMHNGTGILASDPGYVAITVGVFLVGWLIFAPIVGAYSAGAAESAKAAIPLAIRSWVPADIVGVGLWTVIRGTDPIGIVIFALVTIVIGSLGLGVWRWLWFKLT
ncbi:DUF3054 domain-containing protein [Halobium salinum]|uniref:DUF3054 domain-containing protein n=1 Tax=Halobium salinum TaxID=1364940 RepID=A0ABD5PF50_9EURY|nr:DUF3054 domain-containing protein [Halobium salinum]